MNKKYTHYTIFLILLFFALRCVVAFSLELGNDESYYWVYSRDIRWNYFDHPPMVAIWIRLFTLNGWLDHYEGFVRLGSIVSCALSTWCMYKAVELVHSPKAGWFCACLFNASLYAGLVAGISIMPDSPQLLFWTFSLWQIARLSLNHNNNTGAWILLGIAAGLCIMSKVHGIFLWTGLGLYILISKKAWLRNPRLYLAIGISLLIASPILLWNIHHDFITWQFHSERVNIATTSGAAKESFWLETLEQVIISNPVNFILILLAVISLRPHKKLAPALVIYNFIGLPLALLLAVISIFRDIWFHWSGPAYIALLPLAAIRLCNLSPRAVFPRWLQWSTAFFVLILIAWPISVHYYPGTYGSQQPATKGYGDVTLDKFGWDKAGKRFALFYNQQHHNPTLPAPVICTSWWGAHVEYYFANTLKTPVIGVGDVSALHHYAWLNERRLAHADMDTAYFIESSIEDTVAKNYLQYFYKEKKLSLVIPVSRGRDTVAYFKVYQLTEWTDKKQKFVTLR